MTHVTHISANVAVGIPIMFTYDGLTKAGAATKLSGYALVNLVRTIHLPLFPWNALLFDEGEPHESSIPEVHTTYSVHEATVKVEGVLSLANPWHPSLVEQPHLALAHFSSLDEARSELEAFLVRLSDNTDWKSDATPMDIEEDEGEDETEDATEENADCVVDREADEIAALRSRVYGDDMILPAFAVPASVHREGQTMYLVFDLETEAENAETEVEDAMASYHEAVTAHIKAPSTAGTH